MFEIKYQWEAVHEFFLILNLFSLKTTFRLWKILTIVFKLPAFIHQI